MWIASGVKKKVVSEVLKYNMCVCVCVCVQYDDVLDNTKPRHKSTKPEAGIPYASKIIWKL